MKIGSALRYAGLGAAVILMMAGAALAASEEEAPKRGGILTYMIPADAPPSFDGHREGTFATLQAMAPFYSVLIRINPENPSSTTDFVCDLWLRMSSLPTAARPTPLRSATASNSTMARPSLTAADVAASSGPHYSPPKGVISPRQNWYSMVDTVTAPDPSTVVFRLKFATNAFLPALADPFTSSTKRPSSTKTRAGIKEECSGLGSVQVHQDLGQAVKGARATPITIIRGCLIF